MLILIVLCFPGCWRNQPAALSGSKPVSKLTPLFISEEVFDKSIAVPKQYPSVTNAIGGVVPHHLVASSLISGFFSSISGGHYDTVIILAPNHFGRTGDIVTSTSGWTTFNGDVRCDTSVAQTLTNLRGFNIKLDDHTVEGDHSASNLVPYIQYDLHGASVAPLLLSNRITLDMAQELAQKLYDISKTRRILVVCSIDFSHYQTAEQASQYDSITMAAVKNADIPRISVMDNHYLDCPPALMTFLFYCRLKRKSVTILDHSNSAVILQQNPLNVTSYLILRAGLH